MSFLLISFRFIWCLHYLYYNLFECASISPCVYCHFWFCIPQIVFEAFVPFRFWLQHQHCEATFCFLHLSHQSQGKLIPFMVSFLILFQTIFLLKPQHMLRSIIVIGFGRECASRNRQKTLLYRDWKPLRPCRWYTATTLKPLNIFPQSLWRLWAGTWQIISWSIVVSSNG